MSVLSPMAVPPQTVPSASMRNCLRQFVFVPARSAGPRCAARRGRVARGGAARRRTPPAQPALDERHIAAQGARLVRPSVLSNGRQTSPLDKNQVKPVGAGGLDHTLSPPSLASRLSPLPGEQHGPARKCFHLDDAPESSTNEVTNPSDWRFGAVKLSQSDFQFPVRPVSGGHFVQRSMKKIER